MLTLRRKTGHGGLLVLKVDAEKAYDKVKRSFLLAVLRQFGFCGKWCHWINQYISTVSFSISLSGSPFGHFNPSRGLR